MAEQAPRTDPVVRVTKDGSYEITGIPLTRRRVVTDEHGDSLTWQTTERTPTEETYWLCRCGHSEHKPFCDSTHRSVGFDGTEQPPDGGYADRARAYRGTGIVMRYDKGICEHAAFCTNRVTNVWNRVKSDEVADGIARGQVMQAIEHCPSGALTYRLAEDGPDVEPELGVGVAVVPDGPLFVTGGVRVELSDGTVLEPRNRVTLCRCGASQIKPLCDGSHTKVGFRG